MAAKRNQAPRELDDYELVGMVDALQCSRDEPIQYVAPKGDQKWRARDLVDIHWKLTGIETPSESFNRVMSCIIGHANPKSGRCQLKQKLIAVETGYSVKTVKRATDWWQAQGFLKVEDAGRGRSLAYHPQWDLFEGHWTAIANDIEAEKEAWRATSSVDIKGGIAMDIKGGIDGGHHGVQHESQSRTSKDESHPEWVHPPSAADTLPSESQIKGRGIQEGAVEGLPTNSQPLGSPSHGEACDIVSGYLGAFEREHLTKEDVEAAVVAELRESGAGRAVIRAAATKAWREKRERKC